MGLAKKQGWRERKIPSVATCFSVYFADQPPTASVLRNNAERGRANQNLTNLEIPLGHANLREVPKIMYKAAYIFVLLQMTQYFIGYLAPSA